MRIAQRWDGDSSTHQTNLSHGTNRVAQSNITFFVPCVHAFTLELRVLLISINNTVNTDIGYYVQTTLFYLK